MKVVLRKDVEKLGRQGSIVEVADGYARNYLIPKGFALVATEGNIKKVEEEKKQERIKYEREKNRALKIAEKISKITCTIRKQVGDENKIFGSVTSADISEALREEGIEIDKRNIEVEDIKTLGVYSAKIKLHPEVIVDVKVWVVRK
jgi:large subunit ribosomal protein L9